MNAIVILNVQMLEGVDHDEQAPIGDEETLSVVEVSCHSLKKY